MIWLNASFQNDSVQVPYGVYAGVGIQGFGREGIRAMD